MHAIVIHETGGPEVLRYEETERPEPRDGEVLIRVLAASVNPVDWKYRRGMAEKQLPAVLGNDVSGTVEESRAEGFAEGDDVFGLAASGGYAEFATSPAGVIAKKPAGLSHEQAAAIPVAGLTAWQALHDRGGLERGQTALVAGGAGGVGHDRCQRSPRGGWKPVGRDAGRGASRCRGRGRRAAPRAPSGRGSRGSASGSPGSRGSQPSGPALGGHEPGGSGSRGPGGGADLAWVAASRA